MKIKFATEIMKEIEARGNVRIPEGYVTGEAFEKWMYELEEQEESLSDACNIKVESEFAYNQFSEELGEAA